MCPMVVRREGMVAGVWRGTHIEKRMRRYEFSHMLLTAMENMEEHGLAHDRPQELWKEEAPPNYLRVLLRDVYGSVPGERYIRALSKDVKTTKTIKDFVEMALKKEKSWHGLVARLLAHLWEEHRKILDRKVLGKDFDRERAKEVYASLCWLAEEIQYLMSEGDFEEHMRILSEKLRRLREER